MTNIDNSWIIPYMMFMSDDDSPKKSSSFKIVHHRDFASISSENTSEYISDANSKFYITYIEIDARFTNDGRFVVSHNNDLLVDGRHIKVSDLSYREATRLKLGKHNTILSLKEAIFLSDGGVIINPQFGNDYKTICDELIKELRHYRNRDNTIVQSTNVDALTYIKKNSTIDCQLVVTGDNYQYIHRFTRISIDHYILDNSIERGINLYREFAIRDKIMTLTSINSESDLERVLNIVGDDYKQITYSTCYPEMVYERLKEKEDTKEGRK